MPALAPVDMPASAVPVAAAAEIEAVAEAMLTTAEATLGVGEAVATIRVVASSRRPGEDVSFASVEPWVDDGEADALRELGALEAAGLLVDLSSPPPLCVTAGTAPEDTAGGKRMGLGASCVGLGAASVMNLTGPVYVFFAVTYWTVTTVSTSRCRRTRCAFPWWCAMLRACGLGGS
jgi:hypothetical protein